MNEFWCWLLNHGAQIGPLISGLSLFLGAVAAWFTYGFYHLATLRDLKAKNRIQWVSDFRAIFAEFWDDKLIAEARGWLTSDTEYEAVLKPLLDRRMDPENQVNKFNREENWNLELFDRLLALLTRVVSFDKAKMDSRRGCLSRTLGYLNKENFLCYNASTVQAGKPMTVKEMIGGASAPPVTREDGLYGRNT